MVNPIFVKPLDVDLLLGEAHRTHRILTVEENVLAGGFGSAVLEALAEAGLEDVVVHRIGMPDSFIEHGTAVDQRRRLHLDADGIAQETLDAFFPEAASQQAMAPRKWRRPPNRQRPPAGSYRCGHIPPWHETRGL